MAKLVLSFNGDVIRGYELDKEVLTIGRKPDNDIIEVAGTKMRFNFR